jgi:concanavalin A-like lectin/glucanase superfamily protein
MKLCNLFVTAFLVLGGGARLQAEDSSPVPRLPPLPKVVELQESGGLLSNWRMARVLRFDGKGDHVRIADGPAIRPQCFTLSAWVKTTESESQQPILAKAQSAGNWCSYMLRIERGGQVSVCVEDGTGDGRTAHWLTRAKLPDGKWKHVAATWSNLRGDASDARIYFDGVEQQLDQTLNKGYDSTFRIGYSAEPLFIGRDPFPTGHFCGAMAQIDVMDRVLSSGEIKTIFARGIEE